MENFGETQITAASVTVLSSGSALPSHATVTLPTSKTTLSQNGYAQPDLEPYEGNKAIFH